MRSICQKYNVGVKDCFLICCLIFVCEDVFIFGTIDNSLFITLRYLIQGSIFIYFLVNAFIIRKLARKKIILFVILSVLVGFSSLTNGDFRNGYLFLIMTFFSCMMCSECYSIELIFDLLFEIVTFISIVSLVLFLIYRIQPQLIYMLPVFFNSNGIPFYTAFVANVPNTFDSFQRNYGAFREPGVFQAFINISLMWAFFRKDKTKIWKIIVLVIAMLTTFSTTGYIVFAFILIAVLVSNKKQSGILKKKNLRYFLIVGIISMILYLAVFTDLLFLPGYGSVFGKIMGNSNSISTGARMASIMINVKMFLSHPLAGAGITYVDEMYPIISGDTFGVKYRDNTNTLFIQLARFGIIYFIIICYLYSRFIYRTFISNGRLTTIFLVIAFLLIFFGETFSYSFLFTIPLFYALNNNK